MAQKASLARVRAIQRSKTHDALLAVMKAIGAWERFGIDLESRYVPTGEVDLDALDEEVLAGEVDLIFGHHFTPYAAMARPASPRYVYLASLSNGCPDALCTRPDLAGLGELRGRRVAVFGTHPRFLVWHLLKQHGLDADRGEVELVSLPGRAESHARMKDLLLQGEVDAAYLSPPFDLEARQAGFRVLEETRFYPNIMGATFTTTAGWARANPDTARNALRAVAYGISYLKRRPDESLAILGRQASLNAASVDAQRVRYIYELQVRALERKPYPTALAIYHTFEEARRAYHDVPGMDEVNPMAVWDTHLLRELDDEGFLDALYTQPIEALA